MRNFMGITRVHEGRAGTVAAPEPGPVKEMWTVSVVPMLVRDF
jgi:hypothetical protein